MQGDITLRDTGVDVVGDYLACAGELRCEQRVIASELVVRGAAELQTGLYVAGHAGLGSLHVTGRGSFAETPQVPDLLVNNLGRIVRNPAIGSAVDELRLPASLTQVITDLQRRVAALEP